MMYTNLCILLFSTIVTAFDPDYKSVALSSPLVLITYVERRKGVESKHRLQHQLHAAAGAAIRT